MFSAGNSARVSLCVRSQYLMHEGLLWLFIWLLLYAAFSLLLYQASTHTRESTEYWVCVLIDVNKNTSLKQRMIKRFWKKWIPFFTQCSVWRCESRGTAGLTGWLCFLTYTDVTQLSRALAGLCADDCCPMCFHDSSVMIGGGKDTRVLRAIEGWTKRQAALLHITLT